MFIIAEAGGERQSEGNLIIKGDFIVKIDVKVKCKNSFQKKRLMLYCADLYHTGDMVKSAV